MRTSCFKKSFLRMVHRLGVALCLAAAAGCGRPLASSSQPSSAMEPHVPRKGPWFEGWYARTLDLGGKRSLAVIVGSFVGDGGRPEDTQKFPGYIGVLYSDGEGNPTRSWSAFPKETGMTVRGEGVTKDPEILKREDAPFAWLAPGYGTFENQRIDVTIPGEVSVSMELGEADPWDRRGWPLGPETVGLALPLPLHWYVKSLRSEARYHIKWWDADGRVQEQQGRGYAHLEKNWGAAFPKAWNWLQGLSSEDDAQMVLGGGTLTILGADIKAWLAGYRSPKEAWNLRFSDPGVRISVSQDFCQGFFEFKAQRLDLEVEVKAHAPTGSFAPVAVPTKGGFEPNWGVESFSSILEVSTYRRGLLGRRLTDQRVFRNSALEFGAASYLDAKCVAERETTLSSSSGQR